MNQSLTIVLTSHQNFVWSSMQEIIPHITRSWQNTENSTHKVMVIDVDKTPLKSIAKECWQAQNIVLTCFNFQMASVVSILKKQMSVPARLVFHLHNQSTIALWPLQEFGLLSVFTNNDLFISSCQRDWDSLKLSVKSPKGGIAHFSLQPHERGIDTQSQPQSNELYFAGRISRQKNLHSIIHALHLLKQKNLSLKFHIFGDEDYLGSPNMGTKDPHYKQELINLVRSYHLDEQVVFHGKIDREILYQDHLKHRKIFISPSAHSDENFGIAAFRSICRGERLILSNWGGHTDYQTYFSNQIEYVDIIPETKQGLSCAPEQIASAISKILDKTITPFPFPAQYEENEISHQYLKFLSTPLEPISPLEMTPIFHEIMERRSQFKPHPTKIFHDYEDSLALEFLRAYGLKSKVV